LTAQESSQQSVEAKSLIAAGGLTSARSALERRLALEPQDAEVPFLLGMIALAERDNTRAIDWFRRALIIAPSATRIRLELARALYLDKRFEEAFRQFQLARAGNPPPGVIQAIEQFLAAIRREKSWSYGFSLSLAPDTNINNATSAREAHVFGLSFELSDDARQRSGVGIAAEGSIEFAPRIGNRTRLRLGGAALRREYRGARFDDTRLSLHAGPRLILSRWDLSLLGTASLRWYGGERYSDAFGARIESTHYPDARSAISLGLSAQHVKYPRLHAQNGAIYSLSAGYTRALTAASMGSLRLGLTRQTARAPDLASWSTFVGGGYQRDLPGGFSIAAEPGFGHSRFDAADPFFGAARRDWTVEVPLSISNRKIVFSRFTPRVTYSFVRRWSNIPFYDFTQHRAEVGIATLF
jgi:tetratricopeptide (TPR) repeat protein